MVTHILPVPWRIYLNTSLLGSTHNLHVLQDPGDITENYCLINATFSSLLTSLNSKSPYISLSWVPWRQGRLNLIPDSTWSLQSTPTKLLSTFPSTWFHKQYLSPALPYPVSSTYDLQIWEINKFGLANCIKAVLSHWSFLFTLNITMPPPLFLKQTLNFQLQKVILNLPPPYTSCEALAGLELAM